MGTQGVSQCFGCGVVDEGEEDTEDGNFYCFTCWLIYHAARARLPRDSAHVQPARNFQGVSSSPGSAQHDLSVQDVSFAFGRRPQLQLPGTRTERCTVQNASSAFEQCAQRACTQITTRGAHAHDLEGHASSFKPVVGMRVRTPKVAALWRGVKNTSTRASMLMTSLKRSVLQTARMGLVRRWMRHERAREKVAVC